MSSTRRIPKEAGWCDPKKLEKGPNGFNLCRECGNECPSARRTFCSSECVHWWKCKTDPVYQAKQVLKRDKGVCQLCGLDTLKALEKARAMRAEVKGDAKRFREMVEFTKKYGLVTCSFLKRYEKGERPDHVYDELIDRRPWDMDHIKPVVEGGGGCGLDNLRTACIPCHKKETAELRKRMAERKKQNRGGAVVSDIEVSLSPGGLVAVTGPSDETCERIANYLVEYTFTNRYRDASDKFKAASEVERHFEEVANELIEGGMPGIDRVMVDDLTVDTAQDSPETREAVLR